VLLKAAKLNTTPASYIFVTSLVKGELGNNSTLLFAYKKWNEVRVTKITYELAIDNNSRSATLRGMFSMCHQSTVDGTSLWCSRQWTPDTRQSRHDESLGMHQHRAVVRCRYTFCIILLQRVRRRDSENASKRCVRHMLDKGHDNTVTKRASDRKRPNRK